MARLVLGREAMRTWWRKIGRPALLGFMVGLVVMGGLAYVASSDGATGEVGSMP
jgi:hypothetical protein